MKNCYILLIAVSLKGCNQSPNPEFETLQQSKANLDANVDMYRTVWDKILNERDIDLMNLDSFDTQVSLITFLETITGIEDFKVYIIIIWQDLQMQNLQWLLFSDKEI